GEGTGGVKDISYIRKVNDPSAVRLGEGSPYALSPDGKWVLGKPSQSTSLVNRQLILMPTGAGESKILEQGPIVEYGNVAWFPDSNRILFAGKEKNHDFRIYVQD